MKKAKLRVCASCEWVFSMGHPEDVECPKCGFGSYGARSVYGRKAYKYFSTQKPWLTKKMDAYEFLLRQEINRAAESHKFANLLGETIGEDIHD